MILDTSVQKRRDRFLEFDIPLAFGEAGTVKKITLEIGVVAIPGELREMDSVVDFDPGINPSLSSFCPIPSCFSRCEKIADSMRHHFEWK